MSSAGAPAPAGWKPSLCGSELTHDPDLLLPYVSFLGVGAQLALQAGGQPLVRVVRHQADQLHPLLDLRTHRKGHSGKTADLSADLMLFFVLATFIEREGSSWPNGSADPSSAI